MLRAILSYMTAVFIFGSMIGWSNSLNSEYSRLYQFSSAYVFMALTLGCLFLNPFILLLKRSDNKKCFIIVVLASVAGIIAYLYYSLFGQGEITQNVSAGWGADRSTYKEYSIKGYELMGLVIFFMYLIVGLAFALECKNNSKL